MSFGSQSAGEPVVPKFDMHTYTSNLTADEINSLVKEYSIPLDLRPYDMPWRHLDSSVTDPPHMSVRAEDIHLLCENMIDLRLVHPTMLYEIGLTTIWKHVGHHLVFKDGEGNVATSMSRFLKFPMVGGVRFGKGTAVKENKTIVQHTTQPLPSRNLIPKKSDHQKVVEHEDERVLVAKRKAQMAKDKAVGKRLAAEESSRRTKKKKTALMSMALL
ncbi:hypothetical protein Tco_0867015 [Tanacetum coccineum]